MEQLPDWLQAVVRVAKAEPVALGVLAFGVSLIFLGLALRRPPKAAPETVRALETMGAGQQQLMGALAQLAEAQAAVQGRMSETLDHRLDRVSQRMGDALGATAAKTSESLGALRQRITSLDQAQERIERLSGNVLKLQDILSNKQARGAFGEVQLGEILRAALPPGSYEMQVTLANKRRVDCMISMPGPPGAIAIDAKFPLEAYEALIAAESERDRQEARRQLSRAVATHIDAISERYLEEEGSADQAIMFLPSEAVFAELHAHHGQVVRRGFEARVWIASPGTLMALLTTLRGVMRDTRIRAESARIRRELRLLGEDLGRLGQRVDNLDRHLAQAQGDLGQIRVSAERAGRRADRLEAVEFDDPSEMPPAAAE